MGIVTDEVTVPYCLSALTMACVPLKPPEFIVRPKLPAVLETSVDGDSADSVNPGTFSSAFVSMAFQSTPASPLSATDTSIIWNFSVTMRE
ncbi:hypothetical protein D3C86_1838470 [compost metagenome]